VLRTLALVVGGLVLLGLGGAAGFGMRSVTEDTTTTTETIDTVTQTTTGPGGRTDLPAAVETTRRALLTAAATGDYEALRKLIPQSGFEYTFGGPVEGGPIPYWQELERTTDERPLTTLVAILRMPYTLSRGIYVWPFAYTLTRIDELTPHERSLLAPLGDLSRLFVPGTGYLGWRAGIQPDGTWVFFVAGD
jgi:hypothetical protein